MIRFIDINTGNVYNGDAPYIHWFDGKQSVGLNYSKQFVVLTDTNCIEIKLDSEVFYIANDHKLGYKYDPENHEELVPVEQEFNDKKYVDLDVLKTNYLLHVYDEHESHEHSCGDSAKITIEGKDYYLFSFSILACGKYVGEIRDIFSINNEEFVIGADFVDENEALGINLTNMGTEISNEVQRSIYEKDINEQKTDYVLINRKFKELLNEYMNVLGNKGSYKSLINSLNWFEYGDLVKIYEYWKHSEPNKDYLSRKDITQFVDENTSNILRELKKTTYIGIACALERILKNNGEIVYEDTIRTSEQPIESLLVDEPNPKLYNIYDTTLSEIVPKWIRNEMQLKLVLLGNFFATYFMPIHLDLIHSVVDNVVYAQTIKMASAPLLERFDSFDEINEFRCELKDIYHLDNVETWTNPYTAFGFIHNPSNETYDEDDAALEILGVDTYQDLAHEASIIMKTYGMQHYKGIGVVIPFNCILSNVKGYETIKSGTIKVYKDGELFVDRYTENIPHLHDEKNEVKIDFNILLQEIGNYKVQLEFRRSDGVAYTKVFNFIVDSEIAQTVTMYKLVPKWNPSTGKYDSAPKELNNIVKWIEENDQDTTYDLNGIADYVMNPVQQHKNDLVEDPISYIQFISATTQNILNKVHSNQVFIVRLQNGVEIGANTVSISNGSCKYDLDKTIFDAMQNPLHESSNMPGVVWMELGNREGRFLKHPGDGYLSAWDSDEDYTFYVGINKYPSINEVNCLAHHYIVSAASNYKEYGVRVWITEAFVPYFYKLKLIGEVGVFDKVWYNLSDEDKFQKRIEERTYTIGDDDVVCFLPDLHCIRRPKDFMWKFTNETTNEVIIPKTFRDWKYNWEEEENTLAMQYSSTKYDENEKSIKVIPNDNKLLERKNFPVILQPLFGRYDFRILPSQGYYTIELNYTMSDKENTQTKTIDSMFIVKKGYVDENSSNY